MRKQLIFSLLTLFYFSINGHSQCLLDSVFIKSMLIDPTGGPFSYDTNEDGLINSNDEYVEICYAGSDSIDISDWIIGDDDPPPYPDFQFPSGTILHANECLLVVANYCPSSPPELCVPPNGIISMALQQSGYLGNSGDVVALSNGMESCSVVYGNADCETVDTLDIPTFDPLNCNDWLSDIDGCPLLALGDSCEYEPTVLPVEFLEISAFVLADGNIEIEWKTVTESKNYGFELEWRTENTDFIKLDFIKPKGDNSSINNYNFIHSEAYSGINFYRVKQIDLNGYFSYSKTAVANIDKKVEISVFPNPVRNSINVISSSESFDYNIYDITTKLVRNGISTEKEISIDLSEMNAGQYILQVSTKSGVFTKRIVKSSD